MICVCARVQVGCVVTTDLNERVGVLEWEHSLRSKPSPEKLDLIYKNNWNGCCAWNSPIRFEIAQSDLFSSTAATLTIYIGPRATEIYSCHYKELWTWQDNGYICFQSCFHTNLTLVMSKEIDLPKRCSIKINMPNSNSRYTLLFKWLIIWLIKCINRKWISSR